MFCKSEIWEPYFILSFSYPIQFLTSLLNISPSMYLSSSPPSKLLWIKLSALLSLNCCPRFLNYCPESTLDQAPSAVTGNISKCTCPVTALLRVLQRLPIALRINIRVLTVASRANMGSPLQCLSLPLLAPSSFHAPLPCSLNSSPTGFHFSHLNAG